MSENSPKPLVIDTDSENSNTLPDIPEDDDIQVVQHVPDTQQQDAQRGI